MRTSTFLRLCSRAPRTTSSSAWLIGAPLYRGEQTFGSESRGGLGMLQPSAPRRWAMADAGLFIGWGEVVEGARPRPSTSSTRSSATTRGSRGDDRELRARVPHPRAARRRPERAPSSSAASREACRAPRERGVHAVLARATLIVDGFGVVGADMAERLQRQMEFYAVRSAHSPNNRAVQGRRAFLACAALVARA